MAQRTFKILHILNELGMAGTEKQVVNLVNNLPSYFQSSIFCFQPKSCSLSVLNSNVSYFEYCRKEGLDLTISRKIKKIALLNDIDLIHSHNWGTYFYASLGGFLAGKKVLHGEHGRELQEDPTLNSFKKHILSICCARYVNHFVAVSKDLAKGIQHNWLVSPSRITIIRNGVDTNKFKASRSRRIVMRKKLGLYDSDFVLGSTGWLRPIKNQAVMIKNLTKIATHIPNVRYLLIGDGEQKHELKALAKSYNVENNVIFLGQRNDIPELLSCLDLYIHPSLFEGMCNAILEAMATKLPVVAFDTGGNKEIIKNNITGLLFSTNNIEDMVGAIINLANDPKKRETLGKNAEQDILKNYKFSNMITANEAIYSKILHHV